MENKIIELLKAGTACYAETLNKEVPPDFEIKLSLCKDPNHGDFATNSAFQLAKIFQKSPREVAQGIVDAAPSDEAIEQIDVAGNGFINIRLKKASLASLLHGVCKQDKRYGFSEHGKNRSVLLEFVSANPTGPLTIAHGRQAAIGDSLARILTATGYQVHKEFYLNDAGRQMRLLGQSVLARYYEHFQLEFEFPEDGYKGNYIREMAGRIAAAERDRLLKLKTDEAAAWCESYAKDEMMKTIETDLKTIQVEFDQYYSEKSLYAKAQVEKTLQFLKDKDFLYEQDGALWFASTKFNDDKDRVVKKSTGEYTYLAPDIAYHRTKYDRGFSWLINLWGPDHHGYISRLKAACQALGYKSEDISILLVQLTTLYREGVPVRMSTRAGEFVTLEELVGDVGPDAARFFFVMRRVESPLDFDIDLAKQKSQDNPVYYLQYAHARIASLLKFADQKIDPDAKLELLSAKEEADLIKAILEFPKILIQASTLLEPYRLTDYLRDLATAFHKFYSLHRVVTENHELTAARLFLVHSTRITLRNGLELLGISQPESM